jgi:propionyl-CoA carboxylase alpha chain
MIAKLCSYGENRLEAIKHMELALGEFAIGGVSHNMSFLETIMKNEKFVSGNITTAFIKNEFPEGFSGNQLDSQAKIVLIATSLFIFFANYIRNAKTNGQIIHREKQISDRWVVEIADQSYLAEVSRNDENSYKIICDKQEIDVRSEWNNGDKLFRGTINQKPVAVKIRENNRTGGYLMQYSGSDTYTNVYTIRTAELTKFMPIVEKNPKPSELTSPITGKIARFKVEEGQEVKAGSELVIIEAMKMENIIRTDHDVKIKKINFADGSPVGVGQVIIQYED